MTYQINEGILQINPADDRSINIVTLKNGSNAPPLQVVITRDPGEPGETLADSVARQVKTLSRQVKDFKQIARDALQVTEGNWPAMLQEHSFKQAGQFAHQVQIMVQTPIGTFLIFTLTSTAPINDGHRQAWLDAVQNFKPAL